MENLLTDKLDVLMTEKLKAGFKHVTDRLGAQMLDMDAKLVGHSNMDAKLETNRTWVSEQLEVLATNSVKQNHDLSVKLTAEIGEIKGKKVPAYVTDIWESVGTLSARITDVQHMLDDIVGTKKMSKLGASRSGNKPVVN